MARVLVTGGTGFIGSGLIPVLAGAGHQIIAVSRKQPRSELESLADWRSADLRALDGGMGRALDGVEVVVHLAAIAHARESYDTAMHESATEMNVDSAVSLARLAAQSGIRRFVFVSSASVHGRTSGSQPFTEHSPLLPGSIYAWSKFEAERRLHSLVKKQGIELTIVRPPLVYGPGAKGYLHLLLRWCAAGLPMPKAGLKNRRSFIGLGNFCDFIQTAMEHPAAAGETFLVSDGHDISTGELYRHLCLACKRTPRFVNVPYGLIAPAFKIIGKADFLVRMFGNLQLDPSRAISALGWRPPFDVSEEMKKIARWYRKQQNDPA